MRVFVHRENVRHFQRLLEAATDETARQRLTELLREEMSNLRIEETRAEAGPDSKAAQKM